MNTANHIMSTNMSPACQNIQTLSTKTFRDIMLLVESQMQNLVYTDDFNIQDNDVIVKNSNFNLNTDLNVLEVGTSINNISDVNVLTPLQENCFTSTAATSTNAGRCFLTHT